MEALTRVARYPIGRGRVVQEFFLDKLANRLTLWWSTTTLQAEISLSSGESEFDVQVKADVSRTWTFIRSSKILVLTYVSEKHQFWTGSIASPN